MAKFEGGLTVCPPVSLSIASEILETETVSPLWAGVGAEIVARACEAGAISAGRAKEILAWQ
jgi:hypothetical protein